MLSQRSPVLALALVVSGVPGLCWAHHSFADIDLATTRNLAATMKQFVWSNPHSWFIVTATDEAGKSIEWSVEGPTVNQLIQLGMRKSDFKTGDKVEISVHPRRSNPRSAALVTVKQLATGRSFGMAQPTLTQPSVVR
jgi:hypothetical protein